MFVPAFPIYHMAAENEGRVPEFIGMGDDLDFKWDNYIAAIKDDVRIVFLTNPHSPTGRLIDPPHIRRSVKRQKISWWCWMRPIYTSPTPTAA